MPAWLEHARIRAVANEDDLKRAEDFLESHRVRAVAEGHPEEPGAVRICEVDGEIKAALVLDPLPLRVRDVDVGCVRLVETGGEDGRAYFRETGERELFDFLLEDALGYAWVRGYPLAFVHGELALYPAHGFVPCYYHPRVYIDVEDALKLPSPYRVRMMKADDIRPIQAIRDRHRRWRPVVQAGGVRKFHHFSVEAPDRSLKGFVSLEADPESEWNPKLYACEIEADDRAAACTIVRHCAEKAQEVGLQEMHFPLGPGHPVARLCLDRGGRAVLKAASTDPFLDEEMVRVVDPCRLVSALGPWFETRRHALPPGEHTVHLVTDEGCWGLHAGPDGVTMDVRDAAPEACVRLPHWMFSQMLAGYRDAGELDTTVGDEDCAVLDALFPKTWPFSQPDPDLWDDMFPPLPLSDDASAKVRATHLPWAED